MNEIDEEEGSAGPANVTGGVENFSPMLFGPISRIKPPDNKRNKRKKEEKKMKPLREILEQNNNEDKIKAAKRALNTAPLPERNPRRQGAGRFARPEIKPRDDGAKAVKITKELEAKRKNQGGVPDPKKDPELFNKFHNKFKEATSKLGKPESSPVNDAIKNASMKDKDAEQKKPNDMRR